MSLASPADSRASSWRTLLDQCQVEAQIVIDVSCDENLRARAQVAKQNIDDLHQQLTSFQDQDVVDPSELRLQGDNIDWMPEPLRQMFSPDLNLRTFGPVRSSARARSSGGRSASMSRTSHRLVSSWLSANQLASSPDQRALLLGKSQALIHSMRERK